MVYRKLTVEFDTGDIITYNYDTGNVHSFAITSTIDTSFRTWYPAIITNEGTCFFFKEGKLHHEAGPAVYYKNNNTEYWLEGIQYSMENWLLRISMNR